jgi:hypothetical protein
MPDRSRLGSHQNWGARVVTGMPLAATAPLQRTPERAALALAIAARAAAERDLEEARRIVARGKDALEKAGTRLEAARGESSAAFLQRSHEIAQGAALGTDPPPSAMARVRQAETEAEVEHSAAEAGLAGLQANITNAEAALRHAENLVVAHTHRVLRSAAKGVMAEAADLTIRLRKARLVLRTLLHPQMAGTVVHMGVQRDVFGEPYDWEAHEVCDDGFAGEVETAIRRHLDGGLENIVQAERNWSLSPEVAPWAEARKSLAHDPDYPLPE